MVLGRCPKPRQRGLWQPPWNPPRSFRLLPAGVAPRAPTYELVLVEEWRDRLYPRPFVLWVSQG